MFACVAARTSRFVYILSMKIAITGSTGLIGSGLAPVLESSGHELIRLVRREATGENEASWNIAAGTIDEEALQDVGAIVHLAGENIGTRWTDDVRRRVLDSRVEGTKLIAETAARLPLRPALICASAIGFYGNRGDEKVDELSFRGAGFLAEVVDAWEAAADPARAAGLRTVHLRQGIVLSRRGGALQRMLTPFRLGLGGKVGSGRQWWSWISLDDTVAAYVFALGSTLEGPINVTAPGSVTNHEFTKALGHALHRPTLVPLPAFAARTAFGQMGEEMLLGGQRVVPAKLLDAGFTFAQPDIDAGLASALGA
jgi:uncharacterized protein (TIGR01777 family)